MCRYNILFLLPPSLLFSFFLLSISLPFHPSPSIPSSIFPLSPPSLPSPHLSLLPSQVVYVMPSTSGRAATYPRRVDKLKFFNELKALRDSLQQKRGLKPVATTTSSATLPGESTTTSNLGEESAVGNVTESQSTSVPAYTLSSTSSNTGADSAVGNDTETQSTTRVQAHSTCSISTGSLEADPFKPEL